MFAQSKSFPVVFQYTASSTKLNFEVMIDNYNENNKYDNFASSGEFKKSKI